MVLLLIACNSLCLLNPQDLIHIYGAAPRLLVSINIGLALILMILVESLHVVKDVGRFKEASVPVLTERALHVGRASYAAQILIRELRLL